MPKYTTIKIGTSLNIQTGEQWIKVDLEATVSEMESVDDAFDATLKKQAELQDKALQSKQLKFSIEAGQPILPVITKEDSDAIKRFEKELVLVKNRLREIPFKEDAQEFINGMPNFKHHYEVKIIISQKPNKK